MTPLSSDDLLYGYINGVFPMADPDGTLYWYSPDPRAVIPIDSYKPQKSLRPILNSKLFDVRIDTDFEGVMRGCMLPRADSQTTWISEEIVDAYVELHHKGFAHSVEAYLDGQLVGGLYGVSIGAAFFGESMFHTVPNASKVAFHHLMYILKIRGYQLLDSQFINDNVKRFGAVEIPKQDYLQRLFEVIQKKAYFADDSANNWLSTHS